VRNKRSSLLGQLVSYEEKKVMSKRSCFLELLKHLHIVYIGGTILVPRLSVEKEYRGTEGQTILRTSVLPSSNDSNNSNSGNSSSNGNNSSSSEERKRNFLPLSYDPTLSRFQCRKTFFLRLSPNKLGRFITLFIYTPSLFFTVMSSAAPGSKG